MGSGKRGMEGGRCAILHNNNVSVFKLAVMHDLRLIHTDLKPENILFVSPEYVKVPDYKVLCSFMVFVSWNVF